MEINEVLYKKNHDYDLIEFGEDYLLISKNKNDEAIILNRMSKLLLQSLDTAMKSSDLVDLICKEYDVSTNTAKNDVDKFISEMLDSCLITKIQNFKV
jgi:hypothetical protein